MSKRRGCGTAVATSVGWLDVMFVIGDVEVDIGTTVEVGAKVEVGVEVEVGMLVGVKVLAGFELFAGAMAV